MIADAVNAQLQQIAKTQLVGDDTRNKAIQQVIASM
jgi:hypothetical protein